MLALARLLVAVDCSAGEFQQGVGFTGQVVHPGMPRRQLPQSIEQRFHPLEVEAAGVGPGGVDVPADIGRLVAHRFLK
jgi:hypothetical protein